MWGVLSVTPPALQSVFVYVTVASWCLVEIPRYLFYTFNQLNCVPYPVFWLRYRYDVVIIVADFLLLIFCSLFAVLYPTGITGELGCTYYTALHLYNKESNNVTDGVLLFFVIFLALSYLPGDKPFSYRCNVKFDNVLVLGAPVMYGHMVKTRKKQFSSSPSDAKNKRNN